MRTPLVLPAKYRSGDLPSRHLPRQSHVSTGHRGHRPRDIQSGPWVPLQPVVAGAPFHATTLNVLRSSPFCSQVHPGPWRHCRRALVAETTCEPIVLRSELARAILLRTHCVHPYLRLLTTCPPSPKVKVACSPITVVFIGSHLSVSIVNAPCRACRVAGAAGQVPRIHPASAYTTPVVQTREKNQNFQCKR